MEDLKSAFVQFVNKVPFYGAGGPLRDDPAVASILPRIKRGSSPTVSAGSRT